jgi:hypothetical protein
LPFANKDDLEKQMPVLKKKFLYAEDFARASLEDIFSAESLQKADTLTANYFSNAVFMNDGNLNFTARELPVEAQLTSYRDAIIVDANKDSLPDILMLGNYYENNIQMGRYDADFGTVLINLGNGSFKTENINGIQIKGEVRHISKINIGKTQAYILTRNNDSTMIIRYRD